MPPFDGPGRVTLREEILSLRERQRRRRRSRRRRFATGAGAGLAVLAGGLWPLLGAGPQPGGHAPLPICAADSTTLRADVDADGHLDEIRDQNRNASGSVVFRKDGDRTTVGVGDARGFWPKLRGALKEDMATRGAFGDFDGDGYLDLALFYSQDDEGDSPRDSMLVHEVRYGPLARDLSSDRTGTIRTGSPAFVSGVWVTDSDHDGRSELQVLQSGGDGMIARHIGRQDDGGVSVGGEEFRGSDRPETELGRLAFRACAAR
ncbi:hypothetical protein [Streptomyces sp. OR43]|uniref:hypothetical protein n=1 Tax=Streptomyces sp. or43 TaxID=2478957 RepID=UPI001C9CE35B|nr:hypothetical protein [Streptomyces sp. or43]